MPQSTIRNCVQITSVFVMCQYDVIFDPHESIKKGDKHNLSPGVFKILQTQTIIFRISWHLAVLN